MKCCPLNSCKPRQVCKNNIVIKPRSKQANLPTLCIVRIKGILEMCEFQNVFWMWTRCTRVAIDLGMALAKKIFTSSEVNHKTTEHEWQVL
jgi:hypothetical protein